MTIEQLERDLQRELMDCTDCQQLVHTLPAENVPAQSLRYGVECGHVFFMDLFSTPVYA